MSHRSGYRTIWAIAVVAIIWAGVTSLTLRAGAQAQQAELNSPDAIRIALEQQVGKRVKLKLACGQDLDGRVAKVGHAAATISELTGMEFFDATVRLEQVVAVVVRAR